MRNTTRRIRDHRGVILKPLHEDNEPIPGDVEARFTKEKASQELYRVYVETRGQSDPLAVTPAVIQPVATELLAVVNKAIIDGHRKEWGNASMMRVV